MTQRTAEIENGEIVFEWYASSGNVAVITVRRDCITWSGLVNGASYSGRCQLPADAAEMLARMPSLVD